MCTQVRRPEGADVLVQDEEGGHAQVPRGDAEAQGPMNYFLFARGSRRSSFAWIRAYARLYRVFILGSKEHPGVSNIFDAFQNIVQGCSIVPGH